MKTCNCCKENKEKNLFSKNNARPDGLNYICKECNNKKKRAWLAVNKKHVIEYRSEYHKINKEKASLKSREWKKRNADHIRDYDKKYKARQIKENLAFRLRRILRSRACNAMRSAGKTSKDKAGSFVADLGCTPLELIRHIEKLFKPGMTWDNYGSRGWHIDHIRPLSLFDLTKREEFLIAGHYTNLQPLWAEENLKKGNKAL